ncbi:hypothetical protein [Pseudoalteromonas marina]|uniref:Uncharacterized protein n=1 Tax=Pseudoalteromonas marina TaxID=267375 RepID=A0ABT9FJ23_9GAMM|nr:hypothetical protein [Pseudoalteromonas marina]MDP2566481.1 hypothetical protein [Pseudoalteromonas marina]
MKFKNTIQCEIEIDFKDKAKAKAFFIDGDWSDVFYEIDDLEELAGILASLFNNAPERLGKGLYRSIEGFGDYIYSYEKKEWNLSDRQLPEGEELPCGDIVIKYASELQCIETEEITS